MEQTEITNQTTELEEIVVKKERRRVPPAVKWVMLLSTVVYLIYWVLWLLIQVGVVSRDAYATMQMVQTFLRFGFLLAGAILLLRCKVWQLYLSSWFMVAFKIFVFVFSIGVTTYGWVFGHYLTPVLYYLTIATDFVLLSSKEIRKYAIGPLVGLLVLDVVTIVMERLNGNTFEDMIVFWAYSFVMSLLTGLMNYFFYRRLEKLD